MATKTKGMGELFKEVIDKGFCTLCGACIGDCPYTVFYRGKIRMLDFCNRAEGHCYEFCPRTYTNLDAISEKLFGDSYTGEEIGKCKQIFMARSEDNKIRQKAQYGGTVTTLLSLAIESGVIDTAVTVKTDAGKLPVGFVSRGSADLLESAGSNYMAYPVLEAFNRVPRDSNEKIGVVVTPCQATALAKMRTNPPQERVNQANVSLVIGLFCTWALAYDRFYEFLKNNVDLHAVRKFDIPPPPANRFDVYLGAEMKSFPLEEVRQYRMPTCSYCLDMTAEFTDISVGSVEGIDGWNTVIVRTERGSSLIEEAVKKGKLETREIPLSCVEHLKEASLNKKARALQEIVNRTGDKNDLMYLSMNDSVKEKLLKRKVGSQGGH